MFLSLEKWRFLVIFALILAFSSSICAIVAPNILSDLTDEITLGLSPKEDNLKEVITKTTKGLQDQSKYASIPVNPNISASDKQKFMEVMKQMSTVSDEERPKLLFKLPDSVLKEILDPFEVDGVTINESDQIEVLRSLSSVKDFKDTDSMLKVVDNLPKRVYKVIRPTLNIDKVKRIALVMALLYLVSTAFSYIQSYILATVSNNFAKKLRSSISDKINKLPLKYFDNHETGDVLSRITNDVDTIGMHMNQSLAVLATSITLFLGSIVMMFVTNWIMALTALATSVFGFVGMFIILSKSQKYFSHRQKQLGELNGYIEENYSGHTVVKAYNGDKLALDEFDKINKKLYVSNKKSQFLSGIMQPMMMFVGNFGYVAVCIVGALLTMNDLTTFGTIVAFMIYIRLFTNPLSQIAQAMTMLQSTAAASERVFEFLDEKEQPKEENVKHLDKSKVKGQIEFKHVKSGYDKNRTIIKDFNAIAHPGEKIAIVGPTGAGKTTMVNLLMKFYDIVDGDILIDGVSTKSLTRENIHDLFVMVLQDTWLFDGTNKKNVTDEMVWEALKTVGVDHFVKTLPGGIHSVIEDDSTVSIGQKQLLTIARGMIEDAPFLILDEATSNVDTRTEELVQVAMDKLTEGRTSFIIAHRLSTIKNADLILVMNEGNIIETGNHEELLKKNGFYADLYNSQFESLKDVS